MPDSPDINCPELYKLGANNLDFLCSGFAHLYKNRCMCGYFLLFYKDYFTVNAIGNIFRQFHDIDSFPDDCEYEGNRFWIKSFKFHYEIIIDAIITIERQRYFMDYEPQVDFECVSVKIIMY